MTEIWKTISGYGDNYEVSNLGKIRVAKRQHGGKPVGTILKNKLNRDGYLFFRVSFNNKQMFLNAHRVVAKLFIENPNNKSEVNHRDGSKQNNSADNLEWVTPKENVAHAIKLGLITYKKKITKEFSNCHPDRKSITSDNRCKGCYLKDWKKSKAPK